MYNDQNVQMEPSMQDHNQEKPPKKRNSLAYDLTLGAVIGSVFVVAAHLGLRKIFAWAKDAKPDYITGIAGSATSGALGGIISGAIDHDRGATEDHTKLESENTKLKHKIDMLKLENKYTNKIDEEKSSNPTRCP